MNRRRRTQARKGLFALFAALAIFRTASVHAEETLDLVVGQQKTLDAREISKASLADPSVCDLSRLEGPDLVLTAKRAGRTDLILWKKDGSRRTIAIRVAAGDPPGLAGEIRDLLKDIPGVTVKAVGERILIDGKVLTQKDLSRIQTIAQGYPQVMNLATLDLGAHESLMASEISRKIGFPNVSVEVAQDKAILKGTVFREADRKAAEETAQAYFPAVVNLVKVVEAMVEIDAKFILVRKTRGATHGFNILKRLGASVATSVQGGVTPSYTLSVEALLRLEELKSEGVATMVAEPFLTTASGKEAHFHAGGEHGYRVAGTGVADVKFKKFGLLLTVLPDVASTGEVCTKLALEVSAPTQQAGTGADVAFTTFKTDSQITSRVNETIIVSGIAEGIRDRFKEKTPILGDIPILAELFREKSDRTDEKELVLLVTPRVPSILKALEAAASERIRPDPDTPEKGKNQNKKNPAGSGR